jgi:putative membrane protein
LNHTAVLLKNFNWRMLLMRLVVNMVALLFTVLVTPKVFFVDRGLGAWLLMAIVLGALNTLIKPIIQFLTLRFIFITGGLVLILINATLLYLLAWLLPNQFGVESLLWAIVAGAVLGLSSAFLENFLGLTPPIVSDKYPEIRQRVKDRQLYRTQAELSRLEAQKSGAARELAVAKALVMDRVAEPLATAVAPPSHDQEKRDHVSPL